MGSGKWIVDSFEFGVRARGLGIPPIFHSQFSILNSQFSILNFPNDRFGHPLIALQTEVNVIAVKIERAGMSVKVC